MTELDFAPHVLMCALAVLLCGMKLGALINESKR
jgi:hypothetical protein